VITLETEAVIVQVGDDDRGHPSVWLGVNGGGGGLFQCFPVRVAPDAARRLGARLGERLPISLTIHDEKGAPP
jgi:hypothetical protein